MSKNAGTRTTLPSYLPSDHPYLKKVWTHLLPRALGLSHCIWFNTLLRPGQMLPL